MNVVLENAAPFHENLSNSQNMWRVSFKPKLYGSHHIPKYKKLQFVFSNCSIRFFRLTYPRMY